MTTAQPVRKDCTTCKYKNIPIGMEPCRPCVNGSYYHKLPAPPKPHYLVLRYEAPGLPFKKPFICYCPGSDVPMKRFYTSLQDANESADNLNHSYSNIFKYEVVCMTVRHALKLGFRLKDSRKVSKQ